MGNRIYFRASSPGVPCPLWTSDGTTAGTLPLCPVPFWMEGSSSGFNAMRALGDRLVFFAAADGTGHEPWISDGTVVGTMLIEDIYPGTSSSFGGFQFPGTRWDGGAVAGGVWIFRALTAEGWGLWKSDGTAAGTELLRPIRARRSGIGRRPELVDLNGRLIFPADDGSTGWEPWVSDGTTAGTALIQDIDLSSSSFTSGLVRFGDRIVFRYNNGLWRTDGTEAGTEAYHLPSYNTGRTPTVAGPWLYYVGNSLSGEHLYRTDGTAFNWVWIDEGVIFGQLTPAGPNLFVTAVQYLDGELWKTTGESGNFVKLDINPFTSSHPEAIAPFGSSVFLSADDGTTGRELWFSDGSPAGTRRVKDIRPGPGPSNPREVVKAGSLVFFVADDGIAGRELWKSDGTAPGTTRVKDIRSGSEPSWIQGITALGSSVFFAADDGVHGVELWVSDGTPDGTRLVEDVNPGPASSSPRSLTAARHILLYAADDGTHGLEPWTSDGTVDGTSLIQDIFPGPDPSSPDRFTLSGDHVFFAADDGEHGFELWVLEHAGADFYTVPPCRVLATTLASGTVETLTLGGVCGVPASARAVAANLTVVNATDRGRIVAWPAGMATPATSNLNFQAGEARANNALIGLIAGQADALATIPGGGTVQLFLDVTGYYE